MISGSRKNEMIACSIAAQRSSGSLQTSAMANSSPPMRANAASFGRRCRSPPLPLDQLIPDRMAISIIDLLEPVEIEIDQQRRLVACGSFGLDFD